MADFSEKWGTDVDTAVKLALDDLKLTIDDVDVTVLEEPSRGFFGIGSKLALVRVEKKKTTDIETVKVEKELNKDKKDFDKAEKAQIKKTETLKKEQEEIKKEVKEENLVPCEEHEALDFLRKVTREMGLDLEITAKKGKESIYVDINGKDSGTIIGKRGQTLDAIQYLTSLVVNKGNEEYTRVVVDAENYRAKREKTLEALAYRLANKVVKTRRSVKLEPMNPYERKVIHAALHNHPKVSTRSEGQDPYRRVIIELK
ncbi:MAG: RNA-binding cell elongation regulator Jag/EloR [Anaerovoracaceae bacterium]|nr:protein jag [Bacillota bacterium]MEE0516268.1 RNA-binding cell elongation regulator Jag/EloR [Anaerovoracaceae bacterium]